MCVLILIQVPYVDLEHQGTYWCHVYNDRDSQDSKKVEIIIGKQYYAVFWQMKYNISHIKWNI